MNYRMLLKGCSLIALSALPQGAWAQADAAQDGRQVGSSRELFLVRHYRDGKPPKRIREQGGYGDFGQSRPTACPSHAFRVRMIFPRSYPD